MAEGADQAMKAFLMYRDRDFDPDRTLPSMVVEADWDWRRRFGEFDPWSHLPWNARALSRDLELDVLFSAMAANQRFVFEVARRAVLSAVSETPEAILYRQAILKDCLNNRSLIRDMYGLTLETIGLERAKHWRHSFLNSAGGVLSQSVNALEMFAGMLKRLRRMADAHADKFESEGFVRFWRMLKSELRDEYFAEVAAHLDELKFRNGVLISARLTEGNKGTDYVLRRLSEADRRWLKRLLSRRPPSHTLQVHPRDEAGHRALNELRDRGVTLVANAVAQSCDHILSFFAMLRTELAFYVGCLNLDERLAELGDPTCFPLPVGVDKRAFACRGLYDVCLALKMNGKVVGNDVAANGKDLAVITGPNTGGKSTFLRSAGLAQLMMQAGVFVPAEALTTSVCNGLFTHYKREEDTTMNSGKLDEELARMSSIVDHVNSNAMLLFNESFAATNEREGSEIARQIVSALIEKGIKVFFVTHQYEFARGFATKGMANAIFLRAERDASGQRTFKVKEGEPLPTSFGGDLYKKIFEGAKDSRSGRAVTEPAAH
jgi:hypothetical protein